MRRLPDSCGSLRPCRRPSSARSSPVGEGVGELVQIEVLDLPGQRLPLGDGDRGRVRAVLAPTGQQVGNVAPVEPGEPVEHGE